MEKEITKPIYFETNETTGFSLKKWSENIRDPKLMTIPVPSSVDFEPNCSINALDNTIMDIPGYAKVIPECNQMVSVRGIDENYAYEIQKGKNRANIEDELEKKKMRENTVLCHTLCGFGYVRGKSFSDGIGMYHIIARGRVDEVQRWNLAGKEYARLLVSDTTPGYIKSAVEWTEVFEVSELEKEKFAEKLLSRYFKPCDDRAYSSAAIKDFRSRIFELIGTAKLEIVPTKTGWYEFEGKRVYYDGSDFPKIEHSLGRLRRSCSSSAADVEVVMTGICKELDAVDIGNRLSFLIGYGMITWFADVCFLKWNNRPGIMLLGRDDVCRRYAEVCLKMYARTDGSDIVEIAEVDKKTLTEYVDVLKDDTFVINCNDISKGKAKIAKAIIAGRSVANHKVDVPIVVLQNIPDNNLIYEDYVTIDLNGFKISESFCIYMQELKSALLSILEENLNVDNKVTAYKHVHYEEAGQIVFSIIKQYLFSSGISMTVLDRFFSILERGMVLNHYFCGNERDTLVYMLEQRLEQIITTGKVSVTGDVEIGISRDPQHSFIVKKDSVYIPAKYFDDVVLSLMNLNRGDFHRVRDALIEKEMLSTYSCEKNYTKRITISAGERIYAYELDKSLFKKINNINVYN